MRILIFIAALLALFSLTSCEPAERFKEPGKDVRFSYIYESGKIRILEDRDTGRQYLTIQGSYGQSITPLLTK